mgnify:CR=1 FL=1
MSARGPYRILALDVDGTLLDESSQLTPETRAALARAAEVGLRPVLCTGRRYRRARPVAIDLGLRAPLVCNSGALVKDPGDHSTLWRADLGEAVSRALLQLWDDLGEHAVSFADGPPEGPDFFVRSYPTGRPHFDDYVGQNAPHAAILPEWDRVSKARPHFHLCAIGERERMRDVEAEVLSLLGGRVRTFVQRSPFYTGTMCEVIRGDAGKWSAVLHVAELWGVAPANIVAVGDDMNDEPMIRGAGMGVAMPHAPEAVRQAADIVLGPGVSLADFIDTLIAEFPRGPDRP